MTSEYINNNKNANKINLLSEIKGQLSLNEMSETYIADPELSIIFHDLSPLLSTYLKNTTLQKNTYDQKSDHATPKIRIWLQRCAKISYFQRTMIHTIWVVSTSSFVSILSLSNFSPLYGQHDTPPEFKIRHVAFKYKQNNGNLSHNEGFKRFP